MDLELSLNETRVIGCLLEKESTTPDQYPLSLNALTLACNQKSNRDPVMHLEESEVQETLDLLAEKRLVREESGFGSRVVKYKHRFCNTEFSELQFTPGQRAIVCVLLLRGPQTPGELRTRTQRLHEFANVQEVESALQALAERDDAPLVVRLAKEPGKREARYAHLFSGEVSAATPETTTAEPNSLSHRISALEDTLANQQELIDELRAEIEALKSR
ncbi:DUF480 domain-containing protein [Pontibacterium granulatum]|uniref:YceH family protein n=1 Tax=Pontibacterium granulatum TaxID=2036029 RepID=UPI002499D058|nr:DUF480 domain-containing protein [Pontibacterium granulatum]MDI3326490.1 DUF480 domain-containing protein [Pontibacterium granulatum]